MSTHAIDKLERQLASIDARIDAALGKPAELPTDWEMMVQRSADLVERIVAASATLRARGMAPGQNLRAA